MYVSLTKKQKMMFFDYSHCGQQCQFVTINQEEMVLWQIQSAPVGKHNSSN